jgi:hypothetical protein
MRKIITGFLLSILPATGALAATYPINGIIPPGNQCGWDVQSALCLTEDRRYVYETSGLFVYQDHGPRLDLNVGIAIAPDLREASIRPVDGKRFNAWGLHVADGAARFYQAGSEPAPDESEAWAAWAQSETVLSGFTVAGYRGDRQIGFAEVLQPGAFYLDLGWRNLDRLTLQLQYPDTFDGQGAAFGALDQLFGLGNLAPNEAWCYHHCGVSVSGFDIAPIPLPPSAALLFGGVAALTLIRRRSKVQTNQA